MINISCIGDLLTADRQHTMGIGIGTRFYELKTENWLSSFQCCDSKRSILFGNLEAPLVSSQLSTVNKQAFAGHSGFADWISKAGFDVVSIANNHILEHGKDGFNSTITALENANVAVAGIKDDDTGSNLVKLQKEGICFGFAAFNAVHDITPNDSYAELSENSVINAIKGLKKLNADIICLSFHWGDEYIHIPSWDQIQLAHLAIDAGADIIIGHHPHVVQPIEEYKHGIIIYSLGNFLFDMLWSKQVRSGMSVVCEVNKDGVQSYKAKLVDIQKDYTPVIRADDTWLNSLLNENLLLMMNLLEQGRDEYEKHYKKKLKKNRFKARLGMKKQLIMQWPLLPKAVRKQILKGVFAKVKSK